MATIVQPYNPWKEQLALTALGNVAGNIIGDIWKTHRQNEQNRKANAFRGQLQQDLQNNAQPEISLIPKEAPQGYNSNPWANAFHQNNSPLTAFDIGTSTAGKTPSIQDIMRTADNLAATPRFSMLGQDVVQGAKNSLIQNTIANMFSNAGDIQGQMNALTMGAVTGSVVPQVLTAFSPFAAHMSPHKQAIETNLEDSKRIDIFDPLKGILTPGAAFKVGVSPNTAENNQTQRYVAAKNAEAHIGAANINAGSAENVARIHALGDEARAQATVQAQQLQIWQEQYKALSDEIANDRANLEGKDEKVAIAMQEAIKQKEQKLRWLEQQLISAYSGTGGSQASQGNRHDLSKSDYDDLINQASKTHGVDPDLIYAVAQIESGHKNGLTSNKGAQGIMQLMPETAKRFGVTDPWNPKQNINGGVAYLKWLLDRYGGDEEKALQAYNCGEGRVARKGTKDKNNVPAVSVQYAKNVLAIANKRRAARQVNSRNQNTAQDNATQSSTPQQQTQPQTQTQPTPQGQPDREVMRDKDGTVIYQSELDEMIREGAKKGLGPLGVKNGLRQKGFEYIPEKRNVTTVAPALNWSPSYMGGVPQGQAHTDPAQIPAQNVTPMPQTTTWNWPSFDINKPILGGRQRQQPLPQTVNAFDDSRFAPIMHSRVSALMPDLPNFSITSGDETAVIPDITTGYYRDGVDALPWRVADWVNSFKNTENPVRPPLSALGSYDEPNNKSNYSFTGNAWQGLLPMINDGASDIPRFNALTPEDLQSVISAAFYYPYDNSNIFGDDIYRYMPPMSVLNNEKSKLFMLNAARNALRRGRF